MFRLIRGGFKTLFWLVVIAFVIAAVLHDPTGAAEALKTAGPKTVDFSKDAWHFIWEITGKAIKK